MQTWLFRCHQPNDPHGVHWSWYSRLFQDAISFSRASTRIFTWAWLQYPILSCHFSSLWRPYRRQIVRSKAMSIHYPYTKILLSLIDHFVFFALFNAIRLLVTRAPLGSAPYPENNAPIRLLPTRTFTNPLWSVRIIFVSSARPF